MEGDQDARRRFQSLFGEFIYNYPLRTFHLAKDRTADFYIYVFEGDKIFRRMRGFEARNDAQFKTYLGFYVLHDLFLEWQRGQKELDTISMATPVGANLGESSRTLEEFLENPQDRIGDLLERVDDRIGFKVLLEKLDPEKLLVLKLLYLAEFELSPQEIRFVCNKSGRSYRDVICDLEKIRSGLRKRDEQFTELEEQLESIHGWVLLYQKESRKIDDRLNSLTEGSPQLLEMRRQKEDLQRKLEWRYRQRAQTLEKVRQFRITTPYKDIARLLNAPIGTVCSLIARMRGDISAAFGKIDNFEKVAAT